MKMRNILKYIGNLGLQAKLLVGYLSTFVLFLVISGLIIYPILQKTLKTNIESELNNTTKTILDMVKAAADASIKNYLRALAEKNNDIVEQSYKLYQQGELSEQDAKNRAISVLLSQRIGKTGYIYCIDSKGVMRVHPVAALRGADLYQYSFIRKQLKNKEGYVEYDWKNPGELHTRPKAVYMTYFKPWDWIISASSYREEFTQLVNISNFRASILSVRFGKTGYSYILDSKGNIIVHPAITGNVYNVKDSKGQEFIKEIIRKKNGKIFYSWRNPNEKIYREKLVFFNYIPEFDWIVASSSYVDEFYEPLKQVQYIIAVIIIVVLLLLFLLTFLYSSYIMKNINKLTEGFQRGGMGDFKSRIIKTSDDEMGRLAEYFNDFMQKLDSYNQSLQQEILVRKQSEEALKNSERQLTDIISFLPDATFAINMEGQVTIWNRAAEEFTGVNAAGILNKGNYEYSISFYGERRPILIDLVLKPSEEIEKLYPYITREGGRLIGEGYTRSVKRGEAYLLGTATLLYNTEGDIIGAIETIRDITDRRRAEIEIKATNKILSDERNMFIEGPVVLFKWKNEESWPIEYVSANVGNVFGYSATELTSGQVAYTEIILSDDFEQVNIEVSTYSESGVENFVHKPYRIVRKDGKIIWIDVYTTILRDENKKVTHYQGYVIDITGHKKVEKDLDERVMLAELSADIGYALATQGDFHSILNACTEALVQHLEVAFARIWTLNALENVLELQASSGIYTSIDGSHSKVPVGEFKIGLIAKERRPHVTNAVIGDPRIHDQVWAEREGMVAFAGHPLIIEDKLVGIMALFSRHPLTDVTSKALASVSNEIAIGIERKHVEEEILKLNRELEQRVADRTAQLEAANKELETFSYSVSHDLRAPLRSIDGFSQALLEDYQDKVDEQGKNYLKRIRSASQRMAQLIEDILNLSRVSRDDMNIQQINLSKIALTIANELQGTQPERKVEFIIQEEIKAQGDSRLLRIVLENLIGNAWKYTSKHGTARIEFGMQQQKEEMVYFVRDDGAGFDMNHTYKLFGAFQRLHTVEEFQGTGIGLATVQRVIHRHGGKVWAEGEIEKGATFYFTISL